MHLRVILFLTIFMNSKMTSDYKVIEWQKAHELKAGKETKFIRNIDFNLSSVYQLKDSSYLIMPINPLGKSLLTSEKQLLDKWVEECYFPTGEKIFGFYVRNKDKIENLSESKEKLKLELFEVLHLSEQNISSPEQIDEIYRMLKEQKKFQRLKLNFILLIGDYLIAQDKNEQINWGLLESTQLLNPIRTLVLIKRINGESRYYKLEHDIDGKWGYIGMKAISHFNQQFSLRPNDIDRIRILK